MQSFVRPVIVRRSGISDLEERLRQVAQPPLAFQLVSGWAEVRAALARGSAGAICITEPFGEEGREGGVSEEMRDVLREFPFVTMVAVLNVLPEDAPLLNTLYSWGVADVLDLVREKTALALSRRLDEVRGRWVQILLARVLPRTVPSRARAMLAVVAAVAAEGGQVPELAAALGIDERTVPRWCSKAGLPPARRLLAWIRLLLVAEMLDQPGRSAESVARACGYAGGASLNFTLRSFLNMNASDLRRRGAFETVAESFRQELREYREAARDNSRQNPQWLN